MTTLAEVEEKHGIAGMCSILRNDRVGYGNLKTGYPFQAAMLDFFNLEPKLFYAEPGKPKRDLSGSIIKQSHPTIVPTAEGHRFLQKHDVT